jgi:hypothetical protein
MLMDIYEFSGREDEVVGGIPHEERCYDGSGASTKLVCKERRS